MADHLFDFLGAHETLTLAYSITVRDAAGNLSTQPITFTVTGADEPPPPPPPPANAVHWDPFGTA